MVFLLFASAFAGDNEKALSPQRMCTCAAGKGHEKSRGLICVSAPGYVMVSVQFDVPDKREFYAYLLIPIFLANRSPASTSLASKGYVLSFLDKIF